MITDTKDGQTNYCPNCEDQARRIEELERRERMMIALLKDGVEPSATQEMVDIGMCAQWDVDALAALNATPSHSEAWEWNRHVEFERVTKLFIKWYVSEREARFVFPTIAARNEFVEYMIGSKVFAIPKLKEVE